MKIISLLFAVLLSLIIGCESQFNKHEYTYDHYHQKGNRKALSAPRNLKAQLVSNSVAHIQWAEPEFRDESLRGYKIFIRNVDDEQTEQKEISANADEHTMNYTINNLKPYTWYKVWVSAVKDQTQGPNSRSIDISTDVTGPSAPLILNVTCEPNNTIYIQWQSPSVYNHTVDYYSVFYRPENKEEFEEMIITAKPLIDNNLVLEDLTLRSLEEDTMYELKVRGTTRSVKKSGLLYSGEFSESKTIQSRLNCNTIETTANPTENPVSTSPLPLLLSKEETIEILEGESVELQCNVEYLDDKYVTIWNFNGSFLFSGNLRLTTDERFSLNNNNTLTINPVQQDLSGEYRCIINTHSSELVYLRVVTVNVLSKDVNETDAKLIKTLETNLETRINSMEAMMHNKFDELLKLSDIINKRIKRMAQSIDSIMLRNSTLWDD